MIPDEITRAHLKRAIPQLALRGWPVRRRSTRYDLVDELHRVPPKEAVREAATVAGVWLGRFSGGDETNEFLRDRGFVVVGKNDVLLGVTPVQEADDRSFPEGAIIFGHGIVASAAPAQFMACLQHNLTLAGCLRRRLHPM